MKTEQDLLFMAPMQSIITATKIKFILIFAFLPVYAVAAELPVINFLNLELQEQTLKMPNGPTARFRTALIEILATHGPASIDSSAASMQLFGAQSLKTNDKFFFLLIGQYDKNGKKVGYTPYYLVAKEAIASSAKATYGVVPELGHFPEVRAISGHPTRLAGELMEWDRLETDSFMLFQGEKFLLHDGEIVELASGDRIRKRLVDPSEVMELQFYFYNLRRWTFSFYNDSALILLNELVVLAENFRLVLAQALANNLPSGNGSTPNDCEPYLH